MIGERRRLAAIMAVDVVGSSRLMADDEASALALLRRLRTDVLDPSIAAHRGRLFKSMGDGFLIEFSSAVEAVRCAVAVQEAVKLGDFALKVRVGIHQGDVVESDDGDLLGDGVNIAVRLEGLAEPGGIVVSARVREDFDGKMSIEVCDLGERQLKNIPKPLKVFSLKNVHVEPKRAGGLAGSERLSLPERPSLVVLPFQNMSGDSEQEYFADGIVEDITTALSRIRWLFVIARNSAFTYKGKAVDVRNVGRDLGVRYVLEGSVRRAGNKIRLTGQLVEAQNGRHLWAGRFDGDLADVFGLQDRITEAVAGAIEPSVTIAEIERAKRKPTEDLGAYDLYLRALPHFHELTRSSIDEALALLGRAEVADPSFALAKALAACCHLFRFLQGWNEHATTAGREEGLRLAREAAAGDRDDATVQALAARALVWLGYDRVRGLAAAQRALALNPNSSVVLGSAGWLCNYVGDPAGALEHLARAARLSPLDPEMSYFLSGQAVARLMLKDYAAALEVATRAVRELPGRATSHRALIMALHCLGRHDEAKVEAANYREAAPHGHRVLPDRIQRLFADQEFASRFIEALREAGLPD